MPNCTNTPRPKFVETFRLECVDSSFVNVACYLCDFLDPNYVCICVAYILLDPKLTCKTLYPLLLSSIPQRN